MAHYVLLAKLTNQGITRINEKELHDRWDSFVKVLESKGGKLVAFYATLGPTTTSSLPNCRTTPLPSRFHWLRGKGVT